MAMITPDFVDSHGKEVANGDKVRVYYRDAQDLQGAKKVKEGIVTVATSTYCIIDCGNNERINIPSNQVNGANALISLTAQEKKRQSIFFPNEQEFEGKDAVRKAIMYMMQEKGTIFEDEINAGIGIGKLIPEKAFITADQIIQLVEDSRDTPFAVYEQPAETYDIAFAVNMLKNVKVKENGKISDYPDSLLKEVSQSVIHRLNERSYFKKKDDFTIEELDTIFGKDLCKRVCKVNGTKHPDVQKESKFSIGKALVTLVGLGTALFTGDSKTPEQGKDGQSTEGKSWFRPWNLVRALAFAVALDVGSSMVVDRKPIVGQMTEYVKNRFSGAEPGKSR